MKVVFPGSLDPLTIGHKKIILKALDVFGSINVVVLNNINKKSPKIFIKEIFRSTNKIT